MALLSCTQGSGEHWVQRDTANTESHIVWFKGFFQKEATVGDPRTTVCGLPGKLLERQ